MPLIDRVTSLTWQHALYSLSLLVSSLPIIYSLPKQSTLFLWLSTKGLNSQQQGYLAINFIIIANVGCLPYSTPPPPLHHLFSILCVACTLILLWRLSVKRMLIVIELPVYAWYFRLEEINQLKQNLKAEYVPSSVCHHLEQNLRDTEADILKLLSTNEYLEKTIQVRVHLIYCNPSPSP